MRRVQFHSSNLFPSILNSIIQIEPIRPTMLSKILLLTISVASLAILLTINTRTLPSQISRSLYSVIGTYLIYQAPLDDCTGPLVPEEYLVKLRPGHSLVDHSAAMGTDIKPYLDLVYDDLEVFGSAFIFYGAKDVDEKLLASIRADRGVNRVFCNQLSLPDFGLDPFETPLRWCREPIVPNEYIVRLKPDHSLREHSKAINTDIESHLVSTRVYENHYSVAYWAKDINEEMLAAIQADDGVFFVNCNRGYYPVDRDIGMGSIQSSSSVPYEAPLLGCKGSVTSGEYAVSLYPGHSLEDHLAVIGHHIGVTFHNDLFLHGSTVYWTNVIGKEMLAAIRSDPGVHSVSCDGRGTVSD
jgi:hypothetical protein